MTVEEKIEDLGFEDVVIYENPDFALAFLGVSDDGRAVYDYKLMIASLCLEDGMSEEDAADFIDSCTLRTVSPYGNDPVVLYRSLEN